MKAWLSALATAATAKPTFSGRVAMISYHTCPLASQEGKETGGMNVYVLELSRALARQGVQVDMFTRCQDPSNEKIVEVEPGLRLIHLAAGPAASVPKKELWQFLEAFTAEMVQFAVEQKLSYDMLHAHYYLSGLVALELQKTWGRKPLIMTFHTLALMKNLVGRTESEQEDQRRITAEHNLIQEAQLVIAPSERDKQYLEYLYDARPQCAVVVPPGVNVDIFKPVDKELALQKTGADPDIHRVMFVGRIEPLKGIDSILYALKIITKRRPHCPLELWIVGGDVSQPMESWSSELKKLEKVRRVLGLETKVKFVGQQTQDVLPYYFQVADVIVMPSHYESFGMVALEALACGVPVITTNVAGISDILDDHHNSLITTVNNPLLLASQIESLVFDPERRRLLSEQVQTSVQDLSWTTIARQVMSHYQYLADRRHD